MHAYDCYLRARHEASRWRTDAIAHAIQLLHNGLALVGDNARLYAALGHAHLQYREAGIDLGEHPLDEAEDCARRLFALEPAAASGLQLRGWIPYGRGRIKNARCKCRTESPDRDHSRLVAKGRTIDHSDASVAVDTREPRGAQPVEPGWTADAMAIRPRSW